MQGNAIAQLALLIFLPVALVLSTTMPTRRAALLTLLGGILFLPEQVAFDFPVLPPLDKHAISAIAAYLVVLVSKASLVIGPQSTRAARLVAVLTVVSIILTTVTNGDEQRIGRVFLPAMKPYDGLSLIVNELLRVVLPYFLGTALFRRIEDLKELFVALIIGALIYVPFILVEARLSPIFHLKIYGFFQHDFLQAMRGGGFRAFVFMSHGLAVAFFIAQALLCVAGLSRAGLNILPVSTKVATGILAVTLVLCKSMGATIYAILGVPLLWWMARKTQWRFSRWLATAVLLFPMLRLMELVPIKWMLEKAGSVSADRAQSLEFRFVNEDMLLERAQERPAFGWGSWGRNMVFDPETGKELTITDGEWIIQFGTGGAFAFLVVFGMLLFPLFMAHKAARQAKLSDQDAQILATAAVLLSFVGLDLIPNAIFNSVPYLVAGAVAGVSATLLKEAKAAPG